MPARARIWFPGRRASRVNLSVKNISLVFTAGALGGLINSIFVWFFGAIGFAKALGVQLTPPFAGPWLYQRLVWGGIWGGLFLLPLGRLSLPVRGLIFSLGPSLAMFFLIFPQAHKGLLGLQLGSLTPVLVLFYNAVWGVAAGCWLTLVQGAGSGAQK
jgi:hypothetical protein